MEEKVYDVEMLYIHNTSERNYTVECLGRHHQNIRFTFSQVEGVELDARVPTEIKHSYLQLSEKEPKVWNIKLSYPMNVSIRMDGRVVIQFF